MACHSGKFHSRRGQRDGKPDGGHPRHAEHLRTATSQAGRLLRYKSVCTSTGARFVEQARSSLDFRKREHNPRSLRKPSIGSGDERTDYPILRYSDYGDKIVCAGRPLQKGNSRASGFGNFACVKHAWKG